MLPPRWLISCLCVSWCHRQTSALVITAATFGTPLHPEQPRPKLSNEGFATPRGSCVPRFHAQRRITLFLMSLNNTYMCSEPSPNLQMKGNTVLLYCNIFYKYCNRIMCELRMEGRGQKNKEPQMMIMMMGALRRKSSDGNFSCGT